MGSSFQAAVRRSTRAAVLAAVAIGLAVAASGLAQPLADIAPSGSAISVVEGPQVAEAAILADVEVKAEPSAPVPAPSHESSVSADTQPASAAEESLATGNSAAENELVEELRAHLSNRSGIRAVEASPEAVFEPSFEVITLAEKLESSQLRSPELADLSAGAAVEPTPKPAPPNVAKQATPAPRPVVRTVAKPATTSVASSPIGQRVASIAMRYLGYRYAWGGISPSTGFDCSGFTYYVYLQAGRPISRSLGGQYGTGRAIARSALQPGDLLFFHDTSRAGLSHAAIYIGGGRFINSQSERVGVAIASLGSSYWSSHYLGARRP